MHAIELAAAMSAVEGHVDLALNDEKTHVILLLRDGYSTPHFNMDTVSPTQDVEKRKKRVERDMSLSYSYFYTVDLSEELDKQYKEIEDLLTKKY